MKSTGIIRKIDNLGRIVLPIEIRKMFDINKNTPIEIFVDGNNIMLAKKDVFNKCVICSSENNLESYKNVCLCDVCRNDFK